MRRKGRDVKGKEKENEDRQSGIDTREGLDREKKKWKRWWEVMKGSKK